MIGLVRTMYNSKVLLILLASLPLLAIVTIPAHAYGREQWQTTFSFNCNASISFCSGFGFWGWCAFGGSAPDGLSGSTGDCQITLYNFNGKLGEPAYGPTHLTVDYSHWFITTGSMGFPTRPDLVSFWGTGTVSAVGPGTSVLFPGASFPVAFGCPSGALFFLCDTGIPAVPGHYTWSEIPFVPFIPPQPGLEYHIQVTHIPA